MKKLDVNQKVGTIGLVVFAIFLIGFFTMSSLVQNGKVSDPALDESVQGVLAFVTFLPLLISLFFWGRYFKSKSSKAIGNNLTFVSIALFVFGIMQALLSLLGVYSA